MKFTVSALLAALVAASPARPGSADVAREAPVNYDGYHVYSVTPASAAEARDLERRFANYNTHAIRNDLSIAIPPSEVEAFNALQLNARLVNSDLGAYISAESKPSTYKRSLHKRGQLPDLRWYDTYHAYADHLKYWDDLVAAFPGHATKTEIGRSFQNRPLDAFHFYGKPSATEKPAILWHATVHAREWISTMVIEYLAYQLVAGYTRGDAKVTSFLDYYDFYLIPFHNPDGFAYSQTTNRLWRKNRQNRQNITCIGTDGNRNWKYQWAAEPPSGGASPDPCSQTYRGLAPGDTPENAALDAFSAKVAARGPGIRSFVDFHSYGQLVLTPYGYTCNPLPESLPRMLEVAGGTARAIEAASERNSTYRFGPGCEILYFSTGNSRDHHYGTYAANHSWTMELSPKDQAGGGFVLRPEEIWPVVKEQWAGQVWLLGNVTKN